MGNWMRSRLAGAFEKFVCRRAMLMLALVASTFPLVAAGQGIVGSQTVQPQMDGNAAGVAEAFRITATASGTIGSLTVYVDATSTATRVVVGLDANSGTRPGALLTQGSLNAPVAGTWNTVSVPNANVTSATTYWIAVLGPSGSGSLRFRDNPTGTPAVTSAHAKA